MPHVEDFPPERDPERSIPSYEQASQKIAQSLMQSFHFARLSVQDLRAVDELSENEQASDYVSRMLDFQESIVPDAFRWMENRLPKTIESSVSFHLGFQHLFTSEEERKIRMEALRQIPRSTEVYDQSVFDLTAKIISYASPVQFGDEMSADPEMFSNLSDIEVLHHQLPQIIQRKGEPLWAIRIPRSLMEEHDNHDFFDSIQSFLVVGDIDVSEVLSAEVFSNEALMKFFLQREIYNRQQALMDAVRHRMAEIAKNKFESIQSTVDHVNTLMRVSFLKHLLRDVQSKGSLQIVDLFRDYKDVQAIQSGTPLPRSSGRESNLTVFHVKKPSNIQDFNQQEQVLELNWKYPFPLPNGQVSEGKALVWLNADEIFYSSPDAIDWKKNPDWIAKEKDSRRVFDFFATLQLTTTEEWLENKKTAYESVIQRASLIHQSTSSADLLRTQQEYGFSGYPTHERFILPEHVSVDVTDELPPPSMQGGFSAS